MLDINYSHTCLCGCNGKIEIKRWHKYDGIPKYINGHNKTEANLIHGEAKTRLYFIWKNMKQRILNSKNKQFEDYGGRGITICPEWTNDYTKFKDWSLANGYKDNLEIDRKENDLGYSPENCQWTTSKENTRNRRGQKIKNMVMANKIRELYKTGKYTMKYLAIIYNTSFQTISLIINNKTWI